MLYGMSADMDDGALARIEVRIEAVKQHEEGAERERQLSLLERQRQALSDLLARRNNVEEQIESCGLAMQNVRFDLLRLRSAGGGAAAPAPAPPTAKGPPPTGGGRPGTAGR